MHTIDSLAERVGSYAKAERLAFIDFKVRYEGLINRGDITDEFGISETIASKDIAEYKNRTDNKNIVLDRTLRSNVITAKSYTPLFNIKGNNALDMHFEGFCRNKLMEHDSPNYKRACKTTNTLDPENVARITRSIKNRKKIKCVYISGNSSNHKERILEPVSVYFDGLNWVFRAFDNNIDPTKAKYKSFHFSRVEKVEETNKSNSASIEQDTEWNTIIPIHLELHPALSDNQKAGLRLDFGMAEGEDSKVIVEKAVFAWSLLERWNVDTNINPIILPTNCNRFNFHLKNAGTLQYIDCVRYLITDFNFEVK